MSANWVRVDEQNGNVLMIDLRSQTFGFKRACRAGRVEGAIGFL